MGIFSKFISKIKGVSTADPLDWQELEAELLAADLGPSLTSSIIKDAKSIKGDDALASLTQILNSKLSSKSRTLSKAASTSALIVVGVNGTGKTTSVAKLAASLKGSGSSVILAAADTFRAAAVEQLQTWGARIGVEVIAGKDGAEPASVVFDAAVRANEQQVSYLLIDTAGRLHNKNDLMAELGKVKRVIEKSLPVSEVLLVIDATTGQNGITQAKIFTEAVDVTGLIVTKLDGSARGGVALAIENALDIPIKFVGTGEAESDFAAFDSERYISGLIGE
ncbi:FtsY Signal recognition particle GTPase [Candidatus Nanopelagicaceae bacterium]|jgi:fused signal recognition particle receptor|uniref:signal recognition particle-docking protein FtsY n=1 Tax=Candidatus Planktophila lacus TaxID=1884913 RepID=UPI000BACD2AB|nr:signal recognition particle-docking protein FtsY [Candidatus Planktophila lacus]ASY29179.1 fused signal recognition particle receptor [Candidatus Planktophila lacus]